MTTQGQSVAAELRQLIAEGRISEDALGAMTRIDAERLTAFLSDSSSHAAGIDPDDLEIALRDPKALSSETKYTLALRASYLVNAASQARPR